MMQGSLFGPEPVAPREPSGGKRWAGAEVTRARAKCRAMLPHPCRKCGVIITADEPETSWHAGHGLSRAEGGDGSDIEPEHARCNTSDGGRMGARITNARHRPASDITREKRPQWW